MIRSPKSALLALALLLAALPIGAQTRYTLTHLGMLGGSNSYPTGLNDAGQVVGWSEISGTIIGSGQVPRRPFIWDSVHGMQNLGALSEAPGLQEGDWSEATGINNAGQVAGFSTTLPGDPGTSPASAFLWDSVHGLRALGALGSVVSYGYGINNLGQIVGASRTGDAANQWPYHGFVWDAVNGLQDAGAPPPDLMSWFSGINDEGQVVGFSVPDFSFNPLRPFLWDRVHGFQFLTPLEPGSSFGVSAINNAGMMVGSSYVTDPLIGFPLPHAAVWTDPNTVQDYGTLPLGFVSEAFGINNPGMIVGYSGSASVDQNGNQVNHAVLWNGPNNLQDLDSQIPVTKGWYLSQATVINNKGQIVGVLSNFIDYQRTEAVLLTPAPPPTAFASDVTTQIRVKRGGFRLNPLGVFVQRVTLTNVSRKPIAGPISLVAGNLDPFVSVFPPDGYTNYLAPLGQPYVNATLGPNNLLPPGASATADVPLATLSYYVGTYVTLNYTPRILAGAGAR